MNRTIAVMNPKGGVGKSTISGIIAAGLQERYGDVLCLDADPQQTLLDFSAKSEFVLNGVHLAAIDTTLSVMREKFPYIVIDTPGSKASMFDLPRKKIVAASDLVIIPVQPSPVDSKPTEMLINMILERWVDYDTPEAIFVLNKCREDTAVARKTRERLEAFEGFHIAETSFRSWDTVATLAEEGSTILQDKRLRPVAMALIDEIEELL